jgi:hypothetical protein
MIRVVTFIKNLLWHFYLGQPKSSQKQINDRFDICLKCDFYDKSHSQCLQCGCGVSNKKLFLNKLAWKDQKCPLDKWEALV